MGLARLLPVSLSVLTLGVAGCGSNPPPHSIPVGNTRSSGSVHGGQQPVAGAAIQLYTVGTSADGSAATPLLTSTVTSGPDGTFTITGLYSCTNATQVYIVATGGNPGLSTTNPNIALMAALGPCSALTPSTFISINELTTAAAVSALAPYMTSATAIGSSSSDAASLAAAFTLATQLVDTTTGTSPGNVPSGYTVPSTELNTLADILSACINSTGGSAGDGSLCGQLFSLTTLSPTPAPTNTIAAMLNIATNPTQNTSALFALTPPTPPFQPTLTSAPASFLVTLQGLAVGQASPSSIDFLNVTVGSTSPIQTVTIQGFQTLGSIGVVGPNSSDFIAGDFTVPSTGACNTLSTSSCWVEVYAHPSAPGSRNAFLAIPYNDNAIFYVPLSVTGVAPPSSTLSNSSVNFPPTVTGTSTSPAAVSLANNGPGVLTVSAITINGVANNNFTQTNNCSSVAVNASCTIYITFAPTVADTQSATLQITSIATGTNTVTLSGTGVALGAAPSLWPSSLTYNIWGANEDMVLTNSGTTPLSISAPAGYTTGGEEDQHHYLTSFNNCGSTVASGTSCTFGLQNLLNYSWSSYGQLPAAVTGAAVVGSLSANILSNSGALLLQNNTVNGTITFPASQVGTPQTATIQLASVSTQLVNGQPVTSLGGSPAASLTIGGDNPGDFTVSAVQPTVSSTPSSSCPASTGTQPCTITVTFTPTAAGARTAKLSLDANGSSTGQYILVTGTGTP
jgi:hypothetical protein